MSSTRARRRFTAAFKLKMLEAAAQCAQPGELGALLRREGLYSSHLSAWRAAARRGELAGLAHRRGPKPTRALQPAECQQVLGVLHEPRFVDLAPAQVYAMLLDEGIYHCSERTMYRILASQEKVRDRRAQRLLAHVHIKEAIRIEAAGKPIEPAQRAACPFQQSSKSG